MGSSLEGSTGDADKTNLATSSMEEGDVEETPNSLKDVGVASPDQKWDNKMGMKLLMLYWKNGRVELLDPKKDFSRNGFQKIITNEDDMKVIEGLKTGWILIFSGAGRS
eukprot:11885024-Ditylum_brightwellii.AAC.1